MTIFLKYSFIFGALLWNSSHWITLELAELLFFLSFFNLLFSSEREIDLNFRTLIRFPNETYMTVCLDFLFSREASVGFLFTFDFVFVFAREAVSQVKVVFCLSFVFFCFLFYKQVLGFQWWWDFKSLGSSSAFDFLQILLLFFFCFRLDFK